jgi:hypothetical protein
MSSVDLICLANSYKLGARCLAGLRVDGGGWVRPVSDKEDGQLRYGQYRLPDHSEPHLFDVIRVGLIDRQPQSPSARKLARGRVALGAAGASPRVATRACRRHRRLSRPHSLREQRTVGERGATARSSGGRVAGPGAARRDSMAHGVSTHMNFATRRASIFVLAACGMTCP